MIGVAFGFGLWVAVMLCEHSYRRRLRRMERLEDGLKIILELGDDKSKRIAKEALRK